MKKLLFAALAGCILAGCLPLINLRRTPSDAVMKTVKSDLSKKIAYTFSSKLSEKINLRNFRFDMNDAYQANLASYLNTKYTVAEGAGTTIAFTLLSCSQKEKNINTAGQRVANFFNGDDYYQNTRLVTEINVQVTVKKGAQVIADKAVTSSDEYKAKTKSEYVAEYSMGQGVDKSISEIDKYLASVDF